MKKVIIILLSFIIGINIYCGISDIKFYTENYPPFNYEEDGKVTGLAVDILVEMFEILDTSLTKDDIEIVAWAKGFRLAKMKPNTVIFTTARIESREKHFKWVGPYIRNEHMLIAKKSRNIQINSFEDIENYRIGTIVDDVSDSILRGRGVSFKCIDSVDKPVINLKKLEAGRVDMIAYGIVSTKALMKINGYDPSKYEAVFSLDKSVYPSYFAFNANTPDEVVNKYQKAFDKLKNSERYQEILDKYLK